jgi:Trypsin-co-occurring domain 1
MNLINRLTERETLMIRKLKLDNGHEIYVEVDDLNQTVPGLIQAGSLTPQNDMPPGAEPTGRMQEALMDAVIGGKLLQETIAGAAQLVFNGLKDLQADEWSVELNIGLKAEASIIPVLVKGEGNASLKVTVKWKK